MANSENLKPMNKRTKSERREIAKKGGEKSGKKRRERKELRELFDVFLNMDAPQKMKNKVQEILPELTNDRLSLKAGLVICMIEKIMAGDTKAFEVMRDTIGEKPVDKQLTVEGTKEDLKTINDKERIQAEIEKTRMLADE